MTTFKVNDATEISCTSSKTKNGFCHRATLYVNNVKKTSSVASYLNRTWESYEFETVLSSLLTKTRIVPADKADELLKAWGKDPKFNGMGALSSIGMVMKMGEVLATLGQDKKKDQKSSNDWKLRMLKAGIPDFALNMPEDFDSLPEDEKERRLNGIIDIFNGKDEDK